MHKPHKEATTLRADEYDGRSRIAINTDERSVDCMQSTNLADDRWLRSLVLLPQRPHPVLSLSFQKHPWSTMYKQQGVPRKAQTQARGRIRTGIAVNNKHRTDCNPIVAEFSSEITHTTCGFGVVSAREGETQC